MGSAIANTIIEGRVLEILSAHTKGGLSTYLIRDELNRVKFRGSAGNWFRHGFSTNEVCSVLTRLFNRGVVNHVPNKSHAAMTWCLKGGVCAIPKSPRNRWGERRLFRFGGGGGPSWLR